MKRRGFNFLISGLIAISIVSLGFYFFGILKSTHKTEFKNFNRYLWLFQDSLHKDINKYFYVGRIGERDIMYDYIYRNENSNYYITIWELKDLINNDLNEILINQNANLEIVKFEWGEIFNENSVLPKITMKMHLSFRNWMSVNLNENSKITNFINSENYKGFYGTIDKMSFNNDKGEVLVLFEYKKEPLQSLVIFYKCNYGFYAILINSSETIDENILNILALK